MLKLGIVGGTGYTGGELLRLLTTHPEVTVSAITSRARAGEPVSAVFPNLRPHSRLSFSAPEEASLAACDAVLFAAPNGTAMRSAPALLEAGVKVIDLAADFRLPDAALWQAWYGMDHTCPELLSEAVYGLPELNRERIRGARLVANPGCYPTAAILGLLPLLEGRLVDPSALIADAKSGVSGAGRKAELGLLMGETGESFKAYSAGGHRHAPEIRAALASAAGGEVGLTFVPHLVPMVRGLHATLYARLTGDTGDTCDLQALYASRYADEPFVDVLPPTSHPETRSVRGANYCQLAVHRPDEGDTVVALAAIDNLVKGAAGQAVQNLNLMFGLEETLGLNAVGLLP